MNIIKVYKKDWSADLKAFIFEASDKNCSVTKQIFLKSAKTGNLIQFDMTKVDKDGSGEDIYGWNYVSNCKTYDLLIIND